MEFKEALQCQINPSLSLTSVASLIVRGGIARNIRDMIARENSGRILVFFTESMRC